MYLVLRDAVLHKRYCIDDTIAFAQILHLGRIHLSAQVPWHSSALALLCLPACPCMLCITSALTQSLPPSSLRLLTPIFLSPGALHSWSFIHPQCVMQLELFPSISQSSSADTSQVSPSASPPTPMPSNLQCASINSNLRINAYLWRCAATLHHGPQARQSPGR
jgi:hypothetical protein